MKDCNKYAPCAYPCLPITIPSEFEKSLSYLQRQDILCCKINEIIKYLEELNCGGVTPIPPTPPVYEKRLVNDTYPDIFARSVYNGYGGQGMCIIELGDEECVAQCFIKDNSNQFIRITGLDSGQVKKEGVFTQLGHANSMCTDGTYLYVATSGGDAPVYNIVQLDYNLNVVRTYTYNQNISPYGISYNRGIFYFLGGGNAIYITKDLTKPGLPYTLPPRNGAVGQGLVCDDRYIYVPRGNWYSNFSANQSAVNVVDVYDQSVKFIKTIYVKTLAEIEEFDFRADGRVVFCANTNASAVYMYGLIYELPYTTYNDNNRFPIGYSVNRFSHTVYVDTGYTGFFQNGTQAQPFSTIYMAMFMQYAWIYELTINLLSDVTIGALSLSAINFGRLVINANGHVINGMLSIFQGLSLTISNAIFKTDTQRNYPVDLQFINAVYFNKCTFDLENYTSGLRFQGGDNNLDSCKFINSKGKICAYLPQGTLRFQLSLEDDGGYYRLLGQWWAEGAIIRQNNNGLLNRGNVDTAATPNSSNAWMDTTISPDVLTMPGTYQGFDTSTLPEGQTWLGMKVEAVRANFIKQTIYSNSGLQYYCRFMSINPGEPPARITEWKEIVLA